MATAVSSLIALLPNPEQHSRIAAMDPGAGFVIHICTQSAEADRLCRHIQPDVVLSGTGIDAGVTWLSQVRRHDRDVFRILWTQTPQLEAAIDAVNRGDADALLRDHLSGTDIVNLFHFGCEQALLRRHTHSLVDELAVRNTELLGFNERLEDLVAERTQHLVEAQQRLQEQQRQVVQLETQSTVTHLLRGLAHEFNNPLAAIFGYAQRLRRNMANDPDGARRVDVILQEVEHCRTVVQQLSQLATPLIEDQTHMRPLDALQVGATRLTSAGGRVPKLLVADKIPDVIAAARALSRVFELILANAADAGAHHVRLNGELLGDRVRLTLENDGETPADSVIANAVRPFFTSRA
ncbi:MAG: hybrid sensor histidine kinase/response regulator, partial [Planctomycetota bacterium]